MATAHVAQGSNAPLSHGHDRVDHVRSIDRTPGSAEDKVEEQTRRHPLGVKPSGNALTATYNLMTAMGSFSLLPDSMLMLILEYFDEKTLLRLSSTCKAFFAFCTCDQLWRDLSTGENKLDFTWRGNWRASRRRISKSQLAQIDCSYLFSDALYRPFQCSQTSFEPFINNIPKQNQIARLPDLSHKEFNESWADRPFVLTEPVKRWRVFKEWDEQKLLASYADTQFRAEAVDWPLRTYLEYMNDNTDESPLYLFDRSFVEKMQLCVGEDGHYDVPTCFKEDLFMLLDRQRPDHRWLIIGPERSGSTFHKDPNATSAWNAVVRGAKYWIMFPNAIVPPGVYMSEDQSEVTSPLSIAEWLLTFHSEARTVRGCVEGICRAGEVLHVPSGWWHLVVNLEPAIAITQNFIPRTHLRAAVNFLKNKADQVSGFASDVNDPYQLFMDRLRQSYPNLFEQMRTTIDRKRKWEDVVAGDPDDSTNRGGFSFGFGEEDDDDQEVP